MWKLTVAAMVLFCALGVAPVMAGELSGHEIMTMVDDRPDGEDRTSVITMTLINKSGSKRVREVKSYSKDFGRDKKSVMVFCEPADVRKTAFLSWEYDDVDREEDKWLYMPAMKKTRRISGASRNEYFMGTDFTYDDMGKRNVDEDTHRLLGEESVMGHDCWKIESIPVDPEDMYTKRILWVDKEALVLVQAQYFDKDGLLKIFRALNIQKQNGFWTVLLSEMDNVSREHKTTMETAGVTYDTGLGDDLFRVSSIQRGRL
ncbi:MULTISPECIES: outer membrane lipoprotein-sorting protein [unclassified Pseudodesulfovibrio]|uniref:outer membrane lipoprotein-sorting protein n=1 Tax=unclassified Pseudodesulfovibrio TaxID=2661612 RepID=UPI000FEB8841|nr:MULTISPECIES: outer membrane lipoprotein-sorting protein [unclassified Pseudodesulfovibrio]MCJ2163392.1 outer membrane lipoprotein-sorting protein [Pseudodesulfovibrio sp. S3-i]RWU06628.1 outer membrane lipoprotein-sorting protein [Pseudodesulfovibrio sp. S3]